MPETPTAAELATAEPRRTEILRLLREAPAGLGADEIASRLELHPNTVRWHLGHLADTGLVTAERKHRTTPGRPRLVYRAAVGTAETSGFRFLSAVLASALHASDDGAEAAETAGTAWGRHLVEPPPPYAKLSVSTTVGRLVELLHDHGFDPTLGGDETTIDMRHCPFRELVDAYGDVVCGLHRGLLRGALGELTDALELESLVPFAKPGTCVASLRRHEPA
ncbi:MAG: helix-turn-helix domain-containing protein [Gaiellales bacterium]